MTFQFGRQTIARDLRSNRVYTNTARFDDQQRALTEGELRNLAPSLFATTAHESRSVRFKAIPTWEVLQGLMKEGFMPVGVKESSARDEHKQLFTKHLVRLRKLDDGKKYNVGGTVCEALLRNANDGTSSYELLAALWRIQCMNSLVAHISDIASCKVRHSGDVQGKVIEATYTVLDTAHIALAAPQDWGQLTMNQDERMAFAEAAHVLRFGDAEGDVHTPVEPKQLLKARRTEDEAPDLWTTFNVVQENAIKGGVKNWVRDEGGRQMRRYTSRAIKGIDQDVKLNKALWVLADKMAKIKAAA